MLEVMICITRGVAYLHDSYVLHADLKPANILIDGTTLCPLICDFNISIYCPKKYNSSVIQTPGYRAPEIDFSHKRCRYGYAVDVWSLGCILWALLCGEHFITNFEDDSTVGVCETLNLPVLENRKRRWKSLSVVSAPMLFGLLEVKLRTTNWEEHTGIRDTAIDIVPFRKEILGIITNAMRIRPKKRASASGILSELLKLYHMTVGTKFVDIVVPTKTPLVLQKNIMKNTEELLAAFMIQRMQDEPLIRRLGEIEANLLAKCSREVANTSREIRLRYVMRSDESNHVEMRLVYISCIYIAACIFDELDCIYQMIREEIKRRDFIEKSKTIMRALEYKLLL